VHATTTPTTDTRTRLQPFFLAVPFTAVITGAMNLSDFLPLSAAVAVGAEGMTEQRLVPGHPLVPHGRQVVQPRSRHRADECRGGPWRLCRRSSRRSGTTTTDPDRSGRRGRPCASPQQVPPRHPVPQRVRMHRLLLPAVHGSSVRDGRNDAVILRASALARHRSRRPRTLAFLRRQHPNTAETLTYRSVRFSFPTRLLPRSSRMNAAASACALGEPGSGVRAGGRTGQPRVAHEESP
jgi:hypothetical protein